MTIDQKIDAIVAPASDFLSNKIVFYPISIFGGEMPLIILWLIVGGIVCVIATKCIPIWGFKHALDVVLGKHKIENDDAWISQKVWDKIYKKQIEGIRPFINDPA